VIPGEYVKTDTLAVSIKNQGNVRFPYYDSFYYWICQEGEF
jgi:hypothetical protein